MQSPVEKMIEAIEKSLILPKPSIRIQEQPNTEKIMCQWREIKSKFLKYEQQYLEEKSQLQSDQYKELSKENSRLKWLLNVVVDQNLKQEERTDNER